MAYINPNITKTIHLPIPLDSEEPSSLQFTRDEYLAKTGIDINDLPFRGEEMELTSHLYVVVPFEFQYGGNHIAKGVYPVAPVPNDTEGRKRLIWFKAEMKIEGVGYALGAVFGIETGAVDGVPYITFSTEI